MTLIRFNVNEMKKAMKTIRTSVKNGKGQPKTITMTTMDGKKKTLTKKEYCGLFDNQASYFHKNGRYPNYTTLLYKTDTPFVGNAQPNGWTCGSSSLSNASTQILTYKTEKQCRTACNTTKDGTTPSNLIKGAEILGMKVEKINRTFNAVKSALSKGYGVIAHIETGGNTKPTCLGFSQNFGHWVSIYNTTSDYKFKVYDPTKGYKTCNANQIIKATNGRQIYFYQVKPL